MKESFANLVARQEAAKRAEEAEKNKPSALKVEVRNALSNPEGNPLSFYLDDTEAFLATEFLKHMKNKFSPYKRGLEMRGEIETQGFIDRLLGRTALRSGTVFSTRGYEIGIAARRPELLTMSDYVPKQFQPNINAFGRPFSNHKNAFGNISSLDNCELGAYRDVANVLPVYLCEDGRLRTESAGTLHASFKHFYSGGYAGITEFDTEGQYPRSSGSRGTFVRLPLEDVLLIHATP